MITPQEFKQRWESVQGDRLVAFSTESLSDVRLSPDAKEILIEAGLPEAAAPGLNFAPPDHGTLKRVSVAWQQPPAFNRYRIIGSNDSGDPVCLDDNVDGQVVYLNHDNRFQRMLMASSVFALAECLVEFRDIIYEAGGDTDLIGPKRFAVLLQKFRTIDPAACDEDGYWQQEFGGLQPAGEKKWWQFWK